MWFERFVGAMDRSWIGDAFARRAELMRNTDPQNIYVENIRSFFRVPYRVAHMLCELAVREGLFAKRHGYLCPRDKNIAEYVPAGERVPATVVCHVCEAEGEECQFDPRKLQVIEVYSVVA
ncbi:MAG TPA: hypothetical protein VGS57_01960 [Thermoanaerobaculia bacterium]|jgi:hypothetical protein|nr:hypothetical protein [Thermoanaerobaculia bacterium]